MAAEDIVFYSSIPFIYRKFAYFLDDIIDGNRFINDELPKKNSGLSPVSISVGVAFTDRKKSSRFIFKDADKALYLVKENSRRGCAMNCTPFVRQYDILSNKWGVLLCQKEYQTSDIRQNSKSW